jgi:hypothetical protein
MTEFYKPIETEKFKGITKTTIDVDMLDISINDFKENDIIIIKSGTSTGKTRNISKLSSLLKEDKYKLLSIVNLRTLADEQKKTFSNIGKIDLLDYRDGLEEFNNNDGIICLNSLYKFNKLENDKKYDPTNKILYLDEVNDLIQTLTHTDRLDNVLNSLYSYLIYLIKNCKKIIISDATINQNVINLLSSRKTNNKALLIDNINKKFKGIKLRIQNNENTFIDMLRSDIKNKKYFLFGCDGCNKITKLYNMLINEYDSQKEDFILITGKTDYEIIDASKNFKNKYVFYSPSITTGVSFHIDEKQRQYIYTTKNPKITPINIMQMACRTRNMNELIMYNSEKTSIKPKYDSLKECKKYYKNLIKTSEKILRMSKSTNEDDETEIIDNTFFKLYCYEEYQREIYYSGYDKHLIDIFKNIGFDIVYEGEIKTLDANKIKQIDNEFHIMNDDAFKTFVSIKCKEGEDENADKTLKSFYNSYNEKANLLGISSREHLEEYKDVLTDDYNLNDYFNTLNLLRPSIYIKNKLNEKYKSSINIKVVDGIFNKITLLEKIENHYNIERFNIDVKKIDMSNGENEKLTELYNSIFSRRTKKSFSTAEEVLKNYISIICNITGYFKIIDSKVNKIKNNDKWISKREQIIRKDLLISMVELIKVRNPILKNFDTKLIEKLTGLKPDDKCYIVAGADDDDEYDEDDLIVKYKFRKTEIKF